ncbi:MAG TPA: hypothetical protein VJ386_04790 [Candidatus Deferrimicrobiaceae bacterium]|nr:hypothetical protein [Candidatus Deferrimicrobiaceae bacterium]
MKPLLCLVTASLAAGALSVHALPGGPGETASAARAFSLNGKWYSVGKPVNSDSLLQEELSKRGIDIPRILRKPKDRGGCSVDTLSEIPAKRRFRQIPLPSGFRAENSLQMESGDGWIEIAYGKIVQEKGDARKALVAAGWKFMDAGEPGRPFCIGTNREGRETSIVFLEEKEGNCLFVRQLEK